MKNGGWTLVGNYFDAAGDDMPNTTDYVVSGWQQTGSGKWDAKAATVDRAWGGGTGSAAVSLAFVEALGKAAGQKNLKMCFVHQNGYDTTCRQSSDGSMTLVSYATGNAKLTTYKDDKLTYTFGRLGGLAGSVDGYDTSKYTLYGEQIPITYGSNYEFGSATCSNPQATGSLREHPASVYEGVWHGYCSGMSYRPHRADNDEVGTGVSGTNNPGPDPSPTTYGFRLYIGPDPTLGSKTNPAKSCKALLEAKASLGDGSYWLDPDGSGPVAAFPAFCDMTTDGGGWTRVGYEVANATMTMTYLGAESGTAAAVAAGNGNGMIGVRFAGLYKTVRVDWDTSRRITFDPSAEVFANTQALAVPVSNFTTTESTLAGWVQTAGGAVFCRAAVSTSVRPGDTSWAVKPKNDTNTNCGCNSGSWTGRGAYYGGNSNPTVCSPYPGGFAGVKDTGEQKGLAVPWASQVWIR
jgi:hypothetical protein